MKVPATTFHVYLQPDPEVLNRAIRGLVRSGGLLSSLSYQDKHASGFGLLTLTFVPTVSEERVAKTLNKIVGVVKIRSVRELESVLRETALIRVAIGSPEGSSAMTMATSLGFRVEQVYPDAVISSITGDPADVDAALDLLSQFRVTGAIRSGPIGMLRDGRFSI